MTTPSINRGKELVNLEANGYAKVFKLRPGDTVYFPDNPHDSAVIESISINKYNVLYNWVQYEPNIDGPDEVWDDGSFFEEEIGQIVFPTREAAQNEFKRRLKAETIDF